MLCSSSESREPRVVYLKLAGIRIQSLTERALKDAQGDPPSSGSLTRRVSTAASADELEKPGKHSTWAGGEAASKNRSKKRLYLQSAAVQE